MAIRFLSNNNVSGSLTAGQAEFRENITLSKASGDIDIDTTSSHTGDLYIKSSGSTGDLYLQAFKDVFIRPKGGENGIKVIGDGGVELYHDSTKKFETTSAGIQLNGVATFITTQNDLASFNSIIVDSNNSPSLLLHNVTNSYYWRTSAEGNGVLNFSLSTNSYFANYVTKMSVTTAAIFLTTTSVVLGNNASSLTEVRGDLKVDGSIIHGGGGGGTSKGGTFTKLFTTISGGSTAFTIDRSTTGTFGTMIFDVMMTSDTSASCSVAKKFTVASAYGTVDPIFNKIIDTAPDGSNDFIVSFRPTGAENVLVPVASYTNYGSGEYEGVMGSGSVPFTTASQYEATFQGIQVYITVTAAAGGFFSFDLTDLSRNDITTISGNPSFPSPPTTPKSNTKIRCVVTPINLNIQEIGITIDLGFSSEAVVVMNA